MPVILDIEEWFMFAVLPGARCDAGADAVGPAPGWSARPAPGSVVIHPVSNMGPKASAMAFERYKSRINFPLQTELNDNISSQNRYGSLAEIQDGMMPNETHQIAAK